MKGDTMKEQEEMQMILDAKKKDLEFLKTTLKRISGGEFVSAALWEDLMYCMIQGVTQKDLLACDAISVTTLKNLKEKKWLKKYRLHERMKETQ